MIRLGWRFVRAMVSSLRWRLVPPMAVGIALAVTEGAGLLLLLPLLGSVGVVVSDESAGNLAGWAVRGFAFIGAQPTLESVLALFMTVSVTYAALYRWHLTLGPRVEQQFVLALRHRLYDAIVATRWSFLVQRRSSDLAHALTLELDRVSTSAHQLLTATASLGVTVVYLVLAARLSPVLTVIVAAGALLLLALLRGRTRRSVERGAAYSDASRRLHGMVNDSLAGLKVAKSAGATSRDGTAFRRLTHEVSTLYLDLLTAFATAKRRLDLASAMGLCVLVYVAVRGFGLRGAGLLLLVFVFARVMPRMLSLQESLQLFAAGLPAFDHVESLTMSCEEASERLEDPDGSRLELRRNLRLEDVAYRYEAESRPVLDALNLVVEAGHTTAIVGPSGSGKSTIADIVMGLLRPDTGVVHVDDVPLTADRIAAWRRAVAYVPQDTFLLHDTIRANLAWAVPRASEGDMWGALELSAARSFVSALPAGLDTIVGDRGIRLSGGERQRLALARALLRQPSLLILDEATSALDALSEQQILDAIRQLRGAVTILLITHRLATVRDADVVHVVENGRVAESGTWRDLSVRDGSLFQRLWRLQRLELVHV